MKTTYRFSIALAIIAVLGLTAFLVWWFKLRDKPSVYSSQETSDSIVSYLETYERYLEHSKYMNDSQKRMHQKIDVPVYYINMDRSVDRREFMENQFKLFDINSPIRIRGVSGDSLEHPPPATSPPATSPPRGGNILFGAYGDISYAIEHTDLSPSEVGCTLSHLLAIETAYGNNEQVALILEDDASLSLVPFWDEKLSDIIANAPIDWEIIQLFCMHPRQNVTSIFTLHDVDNPCYSTAAYLVNRKGMGRVLGAIKGPNQKFHIRMEHAPSGTSDQLVYALARTYTLHKSLFIPVNHTLTSTIHTKHGDIHIKRASTVIKEYLKYNRNLLSLDKKQLQFSKTLHDMADGLDNLQIPFRLSCGTLLGAYRENRFISYDSDIDLDVLYSDYSPKIRENLKNFELKHARGTPEKGHELTFQHLETGLNVDIFILYDEEDYRWYTTYHGRCDQSKYGFCRWKIPRDGTRPLTFAGRSFQVPTNTEDYLTATYGLNWNIPKNYTYHEGLISQCYGMIEEDFPPEHRLEKPKETKQSDLWPRKISEFSKPIIWLYWQNKTPESVKPPYLDLCLETVKKHCNDSFEIIVLDDQMIPVVSRSIDPNFTNIQPLAMRADYIRFCLIHEFGGIWLDSDIAVLKDLSFMIEDLKTHNFVAFEHDDPNDISIGIMAANKGNRYSQHMKTLFEEHPSYSQWRKGEHEIGWAEPTLTAKSFLRDLRKFYPNDVKTYPARLVYPVDWKKSANYYWDQGKINPKILELPAVYLHNQMYSKKHKALSKKEVMEGKYRISDLFRSTLSAETSGSQVRYGTDKSSGWETQISLYEIGI
jgi:GR25 family glycosyltransferase involved in LPS biosynthesis